VDKVSRLYEAEKTKYLGHWEVLNAHLTAVDKGELEYQKNDNILSLDSGRLIKSRFSGFNDDFERTYNLHKELSVIDGGLRTTLQKEVKSVFVPRYQRFFDKYSKIRFSKKHQEEYTKYSPQKIEAMIDTLFTGGA
jgi:exocyst complex protein 7